MTRLVNRMPYVGSCLTTVGFAGYRRTSVTSGDNSLLCNQRRHRRSTQGRRFGWTVPAKQPSNCRTHSHGLRWRIHQAGCLCFCLFVHATVSFNIHASSPLDELRVVDGQLQGSDHRVRVSLNCNSYRLCEYLKKSRYWRGRVLDVDRGTYTPPPESWYGVFCRWILFCTSTDQKHLTFFFHPVVFLKSLFSVLYLLSCIPPHSALSSPHFLLTATFTQMIGYSTFFLVPSSQLSIAHIQTALKQISPWMSANLLTLNSSKTEFLIIGTETASF